MEDKPFDTAGEVQGDSRGVLQACDREPRGRDPREWIEAIGFGGGECRMYTVLSFENYPEEMVEPEQCAQYSVYFNATRIGGQIENHYLEIMAHNHTEYGVQEYGIE